jgi:hypothetical protein
VRVTTSLLADAATVAEGKLYIHGAGWDTINSPAVPATYPSIALVLALEFDPSETDPKDIEITLVDEDGVPLGAKITGRMGVQDASKAVPGMPIRFPIAATFPVVTFPRAGKYRFVLAVNGVEVHSVEFLVNAILR